MNCPFESPSYLERRRAEQPFPAVPHTPVFTTRDEDEFIWICDGDRALATLSRESLYIDWREWYPDGRAGSKAELRRPYHNPSVRGTTIVNNWRLDCRQAVCTNDFEITISGQGTAELSIRIDERFGEVETGYHLLRIGYDVSWGSYVVDTVCELTMLRPCELEVTNLWARGAGEAWPGDVDLHYTYWANLSGGITRFPHNPLTPNLPGNMDHHDQRRIPVGGFQGMGARPKSNPVVEVLASSTRALGFGTCSCWYDEHLWMGCPLQLPDGRYYWGMHYRFFSIPQPLAEQLIAEARVLDFGTEAVCLDDWAYLDSLRRAGRQIQPFTTSLPLVLGEVNDFSRPIDPREVLVGLYWQYAPQANGRVRWDEPAAALLIEGDTDGAELRSGPIGPSVMMHDGCNYRFQAEIRTELADGAEAWLAGASFLYTPASAGDPRRSPAVTGSSDWTPVEVRLENGPKVDYLHLQLRLKGRGKAWFRKVALLEDPA